jgi:hypothetical protein
VPTRSYAGAVTFAESSGALALDHSASFTATVFGMTRQDTLDLAAITAGANATLAYWGVASAATLSVSDGGHSASIALSAIIFDGTWVTDPAVLGGPLVRSSPPPPEGSRPPRLAIFFGIWQNWAHAGGNCGGQQSVLSGERSGANQSPISHGPSPR